MLYAGVGRTALTPPLGTPLVGYGGREHGADAVRDDIYATSLVLAVRTPKSAVRTPKSADADTMVALVTCDLCALPIQQVRHVRRLIEERTGIPPEHVMINTSHAHSGPLTTYNDETPESLRQVVNALLDALAESVVQAAAALAPCQLTVGKGSVQASINRRARNGYSDAVTRESPYGTVDSDLHVVRIDGVDGAPLAVLTSYACHPVALRPPSHAVSADFVGALRETVEPQVGAPLLFAQGAAGNLVPIEPEMDMESRLELTGKTLGTEALRVYARLGANAASVPRTPASFDTGVPPEQASPATPGGTEPAPTKPVLAAAAETLLLDLWTEQPPIAEAGHSHRTFPYLTPPLVNGKVACAVQALRIGDVALVGVAGEAFVEIGRAVKARSPIPHTVFLGYTNGCLGYIPTAAAYPNGGYEVHRAHAVYRLPHTIAPESANRVITVSLELLAKVCGEQD